MTTTSFNVSFVSRINKKNKETANIFCRIQANGQRVEFCLVKSIPKDSWVSKKESFNHTYKDFRKTNLFIAQVKSKIIDIHRRLTLEEKLITPLILKNHYLGKSEEKGKTLSFLIDYHYKTQNSVLSSGTLAHYKTTQRYLTEFLHQIKRVDNILLKEIDYKFITEFEAFLRTYQPTDHQRTMSHNVIMKHLTRIRKLLNLASKLEWIDKNPFDRFPITYTKVDRGYLTELELKTIISKEIKIERLCFIRDLFVFSCYTGLSFIDVNKLKPENISLDIDGEYWINTKRQKTEISIQIPLLPIAFDIINKYKNHPKAIHHNLVFPPISNQKLNSYLKELADICSINKNLTFHLARHTFATTVTLSNGVPIETVSKILGHTKLSTTMLYARVLKQKISSDMFDLRQKLKSKDSDSNSSYSVGS